MSQSPLWGVHPHTTTASQEFILSVEEYEKKMNLLHDLIEIFSDENFDYVIALDDNGNPLLNVFDRIIIEPAGFDNYTVEIYGIACEEIAMKMQGIDQAICQEMVFGYARSIKRLK